MRARFERAGVWDAFARRRRELEAFAAAMGKTEKDATAEAWRVAGAEFDERIRGQVVVERPVAEVVREAADPEPRGTVEEVLAGRTCSYVEAVDWVATVICNERADVEACPSMVAWLLYQAWQKSPGGFFEKIHKPVKAKGSEEGDHVDQSRDIVAMIERVERESVAARTA